MIPPQLFFPLVAKLVYRNTCFVLVDPDCICTATKKCVLRVKKEDQWSVFKRKVKILLSASPKTVEGGIPHVLVVSEQNPCVSVARLDKDRLGNQTWTSHLEF